MLKSWLPAAALGSLFVLTSPSVGAPGHSGGHSSGHSSGHSAGSSGGHSAGHSSGHSSGRSSGHSSGRSSGHYYYGGGYYYAPGLSGYGGYGYAPYNYGPSVYIAPSASYYPAPATVLTPLPSTSNYYSPPAFERPTMPPAVDTRIATIEVRVPAEAEIWFEGEKTSQTGGIRAFESTPVPPGRTYTYDIRARWIEDGKAIDVTRSVKFQAGQKVVVDFFRP